MCFSPPATERDSNPKPYGMVKMAKKESQRAHHTYIPILQTALYKRRPLLVLLIINLLVDKYR